jgi:hypothetical protein
MPPTLPLSLFTFLMAAHRFPVSASMMLGNADYRRRQLRLACTTQDLPLQQLATRLLHQLRADAQVASQVDVLWRH